MVKGVERTGVSTDIRPLADGGEGTMRVMLAALGGREMRVPIHDPLGRRIEAPFALLGDSRPAVVETAAASGLGLLAPRDRDP
jgi:glycerate 2-kinase